MKDNKFIRFIKDSLFFAKTGITTNYGNEDGWIRYRDIFIQVIRLENGDYEIAYQNEAPNSFALKDMFIALPPDLNIDIVDGEL